MSQKLSNELFQTLMNDIEKIDTTLKDLSQEKLIIDRIRILEDAISKFEESEMKTILMENIHQKDMQTVD